MTFSHAFARPTIVAAAVVLALPAVPAHAQLAAGDIAILGSSADGPSEFSWVPLVSLSAGEQIYFSDAGYNSGTGNFLGAGQPSEWLLRFTVPAGGVSAGVVQTVVDTGNSIPLGYESFLGTQFGGREVDVSGFDIFTGGDSILAFQSSDDVLLPGFGADFSALFQLDSQHPEFTLTGNPLLTTDIAPGLTNGVNAIGFNVGSSQVDNARYVGSTRGAPDYLLAQIADDS